MPVPLATGFAGLTALLTHFQEHGAAVNATDAQDYQNKAIIFLQTPLTTPPILECVRSNGDTVRFNQLTSEFAVVRSTGVIKTYYKPLPVRIAPLGTPLRRTHPYATNLDYFYGSC